METSLSHEDNQGEPNLTITGKLREKQNLIFRECPVFWDLLDDDRTGSRPSSGRGGGYVTKEELEEYEKEEEERMKQLKKKKKKLPTNAEMREMLRLITIEHKRSINDSFPSPYPLLGAAVDSDEDDNGNGGKSGSSEKQTTVTLQDRRFGPNSKKKQKTTSKNKKTNANPNSRKRGKK
jgi:hypothetical protein